MLNITSSPLTHSSQVLRLLAQLQLTSAAYLEHYGFDPKSSSYTDSLILKTRDVEDLNSFVRSIVMCAYADVSSVSTLSRVVEISLTEAKIWAKRVPGRSDIVELIEELQRVLAIESVPHTREAILAEIKQTPGTLDKFKRILVGESTVEYLSLSPRERQLYESFRSEVAK